MDKLLIQGGARLKGSIPIEGAKNALLPLMCTSLLTDSVLTLRNAVPLADVCTMMRLLNYLGTKTEYSQEKKTLTLQMERLVAKTAPYDIVRKMRASILVLGPLLARYGTACVSLPGGCAIGVRPVNLHMEALRTLGAELTLKEGYIHAHTKNGLRGGTYTFPLVSVTGTANVLMAATLAKGTTRIHNAALEPEIGDLIDCLSAMGAQIQGKGTATLTIEGVSTLSGADHTTLPDRLETGTYMVAAAITGGELTLEGTSLEILPTFTKILQKIGVTCTEKDGRVYVQSPPPHMLKPINIATAPYPGLATDLQAQLVALLALTPGESRVEETIFENRFMHVAELARMGASIEKRGNTLVIQGQQTLTAADVMATDLRASAGLVLAALAAEGKSAVRRVYHLDRGYFALEQKLTACGADIVRVADKEASALPIQ